MSSNCRYFVIRDLDGVDCLRVEIDDPVAGTTSRIVIPLSDIERTIDQYKADFYRHTARRVRISTEPESMPVGVAVRIRDIDTGEAIEHVARIAITLNPQMINTADLTFYDLEATGSGDVKTRREIVEDPEVDLNAFIIGPWR